MCWRKIDFGIYGMVLYAMHTVLDIMLSLICRYKSWLEEVCDLPALEVETDGYQLCNKTSTSFDSGSLL